MFNPQKTALTSDDAMHQQEKTIRQIIYRYYMVTEVTLQSTMVVPWYYLQMIWRIVCRDCMYTHIQTYILDLILMNVVQEITLVNTIANIVLIRTQ